MTFMTKFWYYMWGMPTPTLITNILDNEFGFWMVV